MIHTNTILYFYFIRHGESEQNIQTDLIAGRSPEANLSKRGHAQAKALGGRLKNQGVRFDRCYASTLTRAVQTAEEICRVMEISVEEIILSEKIIEFSQGEWEAKARSEVYTAENLAYINSKGHLFVPPGGESQRMVERRASMWLEDEILYNNEIIKSGKPVHIAVISHGILLKCLFHYIMRFDDRFIWRIRLDNCSVSRFLFKKEGWFPLCINESAHIE